MNLAFVNSVHSILRVLVDKYSLVKKMEINDGETYSIEYISISFVIRLEKYRSEFYVTLYKIGRSNSGISLFNLLAFLIRPPNLPPVADFFTNERDIDKRYQKQLTNIINVMDQYFTVIDHFFSDENYEAKIAEVDAFMVKKYPELFKKRDK